MSPQSTILNDWSDFWFDGVGVNVIPANTKNKNISINWKEYQNKPIPKEIHESRKNAGYYSNGIAIILGEVFRGPYQGNFLVGIDIDRKLGLTEFLNRNNKSAFLKDFAQKTIVEQHKDELHKAHIYFYSPIPFPQKTPDAVIGLEVKSKGEHGTMFVSSSTHTNGYNYEIVGPAREPLLLSTENAMEMMNHIDYICTKYGLEYLQNERNQILTEPLKKLIKTLKIDADFQYRIPEGMRHTTLLSFADSLLINHKNNKKISKDELKSFLIEVNEKVCSKPLPQSEINEILKSAIDWVEDLDLDNNTDESFEDNDDDDNNNDKNNSKRAILKQLKPEIKEQLSRHVWEIIQYSPLKFLIAHSDFKQIVYAEIKKYNVSTKKNDIKEDTIETETSETISYLNLSRIVIGGIPQEVTLNKNPLGLFEHKYTIKFVTQSNDSFKIGPKTLDEVVTYLKDRSLVYMSTKTTEVLSIMINAFESNGQLIVKNDVDTPGFYFIEGMIRQYNSINTNHPKPIFDQTKTCCELLDILQLKFKNKDVLPTIVKWSIVAPFNYILKQVHKKWMKWLYPYGWSNTGKSTLGDICCCVWNRYEDKDATLSFTAVDTKARLGEALSRSTYPLVVNEVAQLNDEHRNKDMVEMIKTAITDLNARKKFVNKTIYTDIPSFSPCILTGNSVPPSDTGFRRRIIPITFTEKDQYSKDEIIEFEKLFHERVKHELRYLGDFAVNYIMEHQQELLLDGKKDWKEVAEIILTEMYKSIQKEPPEWIKYFVKESQLEDSKEDIDLLFRSFLINKVNETYNKYYRNVDKDNIVSNLPFSSRLNFCLENNLIPFLNLITTDGTTLIAITSDLVSELKQKISQISSLNEVSSIVDGFKYGQKRIGRKNTKTAYGTKNDLLNFLGME